MNYIVKWEYKVVDLQPAMFKDELDNWLNAQGDEGWELASVINSKRFILRRAKEELFGIKVKEDE